MQTREEFLVGSRSRDRDTRAQREALTPTRAELDPRQAIQQLDFAQKLTNNFQLSARLDARKRELMDQERALKEMMN